MNTLGHQGDDVWTGSNVNKCLGMHVFDDIPYTRLRTEEPEGRIRSTSSSSTDEKNLTSTNAATHKWQQLYPKSCWGKWEEYDMARPYSSLWEEKNTGKMLPRQ